MVRAFALPLLKPWQGAPPHHCSLLQFFPKCDQNPPFSVTQRTSHLRGPSYSAQQVPLPLHLQRVCPLAKKKDEKTITDFTSGCQCCCKTQQSGVSHRFPSLRYKQYITAANRTKRFFFQTNTQLTLFLFSLDDKIVRGYLKCEISGVDAAVMTTESPGHWRRRAEKRPSSCSQRIDVRAYKCCHYCSLVLPGMAEFSLM